MPTRLAYRPRKTEYPVKTDMPSKTWETLRAAFGDPCLLDQSHYETLIAMSFVDRHAEDNPFERLAQAIQKYGKIEVFASS